MAQFDFGLPTLLAAGKSGFYLRKVICFMGSLSGSLMICPNKEIALLLMVVEKVSSWRFPSFEGLLLITSRLACSRTVWFVAVRSKCVGKYPKMRLSPLCWKASSLLRSAGVSWSDSSPYNIFAPAMALKTRSFHLGFVLLVQKYFRAVIVARVEVILAFRSGLLDALSSNEIPKYLASGTLLRWVPSSKWVWDFPFMVMVMHFSLLSFMM